LNSAFILAFCATSGVNESCTIRSYIARAAPSGGHGRFVGNGADVVNLSQDVDVLIVSDIRLYRQGLAEMLARDGRLGAVSTASSIPAAKDALKAGRTYVVLLDMGMPESLDAVRTIATSGHLAKVVALGISETRHDVVGCAEAGARGYVCRESSLEELIEAVRSAADGELRCPPGIAAALMDSVAKLAARMIDPKAQLTSRELEIAELLDQGLANREIAGRLHIAVATVKVHVHNILDKLGTRRRAEAAAKLRRCGLLQLPRVPALQDYERI
jgi:two-component system, NarL family, nitrate/nitrite response regulator NarL